MGMAKRAFVAVTTRALIQRINRRLAKDERILKTARSQRTEQSVGKFFVVDLARNYIVEQDVHPETLGRELGVLDKWERVQDDE
jgi:hypothetical protein